MLDDDARKLEELAKDSNNQQLIKLNNFLVDSLCDAGSCGIYERAQRTALNLNASNVCFYLYFIIF